MFTIQYNNQLSGVWENSWENSDQISQTDNQKIISQQRQCGEFWLHSRTIHGIKMSIYHEQLRTKNGDLSPCARYQLWSIQFMQVIKLADPLSVVIIMGQKLAYCEMLLCTIWNNFHRELRSRVTLLLYGRASQLDYQVLNDQCWNWAHLVSV